MDPTPLWENTAEMAKPFNWEILLWWIPLILWIIVGSAIIYAIILAYFKLIRFLKS